MSHPGFGKLFFELAGFLSAILVKNMTMSDNGHHALKDMIELEMYLVAQSHNAPWPMLPRRRMPLPVAREPYCNPIESNTARELVQFGLIEYSSSITLVVSKSGKDFYEREMKERLE